MLLYALGGNVWCWVFYASICVVVSFRWQSELLGLLGVNVCLLGLYRWRYVLLGILGGNV